MKPDANTDTQEFNIRNSIYIILFNYVIRTRQEFMNKAVGDLSRKKLKAFIKSTGLQINGGKSDNPTLKMNDGDQIAIPCYHISFTCKHNPEYHEPDEPANEIEDQPQVTAPLKQFVETVAPKPAVTEPEAPPVIKTPVIKPAVVNHPEFSAPKTEINEVKQNSKEAIVPKSTDERIKDVLQTNLGTLQLGQIKEDKIKLAFALIIKLFQDIGFEKIKTSDMSYELTDFITSKLVNSNVFKELNISKHQINFKGKLVEFLIQAKMENENSLRLLNDNLANGQYNDSPFSYLKDFWKIVSIDSFQYLVGPLLNSKVSSQIAIQNLLQSVNTSLLLEGFEAKFKHYDNSKPKFEAYFALLKECDDYTTGFLFVVADYLFHLLKINCDTAIEKAAQINIKSTNRKYNFSNTDRLEQEIFLVISNYGEGLAKNITISSLSDRFRFEPLTAGILRPGEIREISVISSVKYDAAFKPELSVQFQCEEISGTQSNSSSIIEFQVQKAEIPWEELKKQNPYSNSVIDSIEKLYGRQEIMDELRLNILSDNIESYKLWGQKRVGKSSIAKTLKTILDKEEEKIIIVYRSLGGLRNTDPTRTLNSLGESLSSEVYQELDKKIKTPALLDALRKIQPPQYTGSLFPLENYINQLRRIDGSLKFIFILDEFDRINEEFFLPGNHGETLSLSIGKGLNEIK